MASIVTSPVNISAGPLTAGVFGLISMRPPGFEISGPAPPFWPRSVDDAPAVRDTSAAAWSRERGPAVWSSPAYRRCSRHQLGEEELLAMTMARCGAFVEQEFGRSATQERARLCHRGEGHAGRGRELDVVVARRRPRPRARPRRAAGGTVRGRRRGGRWRRKRRSGVGPGQSQKRSAARRPSPMVGAAVSSTGPRRPRGPGRDSRLECARPPVRHLRHARRPADEDKAAVAETRADGPRPSRHLRRRRRRRCTSRRPCPAPGPRGRLGRRAGEVDQPRTG